MGVNVYVVRFGKHECFVVDPGAGATRIAEYIAKERLACRGIALTHGHLDHTQALPSLLFALADMNPGEPLPRVAIHGLDAKYLGTDGKATNAEIFRSLGALDYFEKFWVDMPGADILLKEGDGLFGSGYTVLHTPGHTHGSICIHNGDEGILYSGDTMFEGGIGRLDADGNGTLMAQSLLRLSELPDTTVVYPGHGGPTTIGDESRN